MDILHEVKSEDSDFYDWMVKEYGFFIAAKWTGNWTGLTAEQEEKAVKIYQTELSLITQTMPVHLYWICMVSSSDYCQIQQDKFIPGS